MTDISRLKVHAEYYRYIRTPYARLIVHALAEHLSPREILIYPQNSSSEYLGTFGNFYLEESYVYQAYICSIF